MQPVLGDWGRDCCLLALCGPGTKCWRHMHMQALARWGLQRAAAERPHLPQRPYPLALHFSKRFGMPAINFSKKLGPPSSAGWL